MEVTFMKVLLRVLSYILIDWVILLPVRVLLIMVWLIIGLAGVFDGSLTMREYYNATVKDNPCLELIGGWLRTGKLE
jgi:hypothetical protein